VKKVTSPCLYRHDNGTYYFRRAVPKDLVTEVGKSTWKHSLETRDLRAAALRSSEHLRDTEAEILRLRRGFGTAAESSEDVESQIKSDFEARRRRNFLRVRPDHLLNSSLSPEQLTSRVQQAEENLADLQRNMIASPRVSERLAAECMRVADEIGQEIDPQSRLGRLVAVELWQTLVRAEKVFLAQVRQDTNALEQLRPIEPHTRATLGEVLLAYRNERDRRWSPKTRLKFDTISKVLESALGLNRAIREIDRASLRRVRDTIQDLPPNYSKRDALAGLSLHVRAKPWHLAGVFETSGEAETKAAQVGGGYVIVYGETRPGSDDFVCHDHRA
jgi:hypothetical protein